MKGNHVYCRAMSTGTSTDPKPLGFFQRIFRRKPSCVVDDTLTAHTGQKRVTISPRRYSTPVVQSVAVVHPMEKLLVLKGNMDGWTTGKGKPSNAKFSDKDRRSMQRRSSRRRKNRPRLTKDLSFVDVSQPLEYPCTPETLLSYHKRKEMLGPTEEWLVVELNEYECLIESLEIIQVIAKHSRFFEIEPGELWEEFFEFVEDVPSYDEIINKDVWQEFRDKKYPF